MAPLVVAFFELGLEMLDLALVAAFFLAAAGGLLLKGDDLVAQALDVRGEGSEEFFVGGVAG